MSASIRKRLWRQLIGGTRANISTPLENFKDVNFDLNSAGDSVGALYIDVKDLRR